MRVSIGIEILEDEELIVCADQVVRQRLEIAVRAVRQLIDDEAHILIRVVLVPGRIGARRIVIEYLLSLEAKDDAVFITADRIADLDVCTVKRAECDGTIHHELHVARARCFL